MKMPEFRHLVFRDTSHGLRRYVVCSKSCGGLGGLVIYMGQTFCPFLKVECLPAQIACTKHVLTSYLAKPTSHRDLEAFHSRISLA
jgi:hypothetical protein